MYLRLRGRDGNSTVVISWCPWTQHFDFEVTWDAPTTRPVFEWFGWPLAKLDRVAAPFVEVDDALFGYIVDRTGSHPGWGRVFDRPEGVSLRGTPRTL